MRDEEARELWRVLMEDTGSFVRTEFLKRLVPAEFRQEDDPHAAGNDLPGGAEWGAPAWILKFCEPDGHFGTVPVVVALADGGIVKVDSSALKIRGGFLP